MDELNKHFCCLTFKHQMPSCQIMAVNTNKIAYFLISSLKFQCRTCPGLRGLAQALQSTLTAYKADDPSMGEVCNMVRNVCLNKQCYDKNSRTSCYHWIR